MKTILCILSALACVGFLSAQVTFPGNQMPGLPQFPGPQQRPYFPQVPGSSPQLPGSYLPGGPGGLPPYGRPLQGYGGQGPIVLPPVFRNSQRVIGGYPGPRDQHVGTLPNGLRIFREVSDDDNTVVPSLPGGGVGFPPVGRPSVFPGAGPMQGLPFNPAQQYGRPLGQGFPPQPYGRGYPF